MAELTVTEVKRIVETLLFAADEPLNVAALMNVFEQDYEDPRPFRELLVAALDELEMDCEGRGIELVQVASGFRLQVDKVHSEWVHKLWRRNPPRYSRALLETLAMIAYQQPITRGEIDEVRGVTTSGNILRRLQERGWVRELGRKQVPGLPILYGTTRAFLDYFNLRSIGDLPPLVDGDSLRVKEERVEPPRIVANES